MTTVRTRFAPSPTGYLHVGSARTALFSWLYARKCKGECILRIEDTDLERSTKESIQAIFDGMQWLDLKYDEGPFFQTEHFERYKELIQKLLDEGKAYKCYCTKERLEKLREDQLLKKAKPMYDKKCRDLTQEQEGPYVIRFKNPQEGSVKFIDKVCGEIEFKNSELDDLIIARTDGSPTYNFTVVVDDMDMNVTHVIRGADHINNTPRQVNILMALGGEVPIYAHVPMILGEDGKKLSKRHGAVSVIQYRADGFLPEALINYLVRLGWSHGDQEIFSVAELIECFNLDHINNSPAAMNMEKLLWLNQHYIKTLDAKYIAEELKWHLAKLNVDVSGGPSLIKVVNAQAERCKTLKEMAEKSCYFYENVTEYDEKAAQKNLKEASAEILRLVFVELEKLPKWQAEDIHNVVIGVSELLEIKLGKIAQPIRVAVSGGTISPPIDVTLELIGRESVLERLTRAIDYCTALTH